MVDFCADFTKFAHASQQTSMTYNFSSFRVTRRSAHRRLRRASPARHLFARSCARPAAALRGLPRGRRSPRPVMFNPRNTTRVWRAGGLFAGNQPTYLFYRISANVSNLTAKHLTVFGLFRIAKSRAEKFEAQIFLTFSETKSFKKIQLGKFQLAPAGSSPCCALSWTSSRSERLRPALRGEREAEELHVPRAARAAAGRR